MLECVLLAGVVWMSAPPDSPAMVNISRADTIIKDGDELTIKTNGRWVTFEIPDKWLELKEADLVSTCIDQARIENAINQAFNQIK